MNLTTSDTSCEWNDTTLSFCDLFHLAQCPWCSSMLKNAIKSVSFLSLNNNPLYVHDIFCLVHSSFDEHLDCLNILAIANDAVNDHV